MAAVPSTLPAAARGSQHPQDMGLQHNTVLGVLAGKVPTSHQGTCPRTLGTTSGCGVPWHHASPGSSCSCPIVSHHSRCPSPWRPWSQHACSSLHPLQLRKAPGRMDRQVDRWTEPPAPASTQWAWPEAGRGSRRRRAHVLVWYWAELGTGGPSLAAQEGAVPVLPQDRVPARPPPHPQSKHGPAAPWGRGTGCTPQAPHGSSGSGCRTGLTPPGQDQCPPACPERGCPSRLSSWEMEGPTQGSGTDVGQLQRQLGDIAQVGVGGLGGLCSPGHPRVPVPQGVPQGGPVRPAWENNQLHRTLHQAERGVSRLQVEVQQLWGDFSERAQQHRRWCFGGEGGGAVPSSAGHAACAWPSASCVCSSSSRVDSTAGGAQRAVGRGCAGRAAVPGGGCAGQGALLGPCGPACPEPWDSRCHQGNTALLSPAMSTGGWGAAQSCWHVPPGLLANAVTLGVLGARQLSQLLHRRLCLPGHGCWWVGAGGSCAAPVPAGQVRGLLL